MNLYYKLKVKEVIKETEEAVTVVFQKPDNEFTYKPGQFLTLITQIGGESHRRSYSLCSHPKVDENPAVTVKRVVKGKVSNFLADTLRPGSDVEVMQPMGTFTIEPDYHIKRDVVLISAGSGITPLMSIAKAVLTLEPLSKVYLIYGNRNENSIIFKNLIHELKKAHDGRFEFVHVLSQPKDISFIPSGRLSRSLIIKLIEQYNISHQKADYYICGPEGMMEEATEALKLLNVPLEKIKKESFLPTGSQEAAGEVVEDEQIKTQDVTIMYQGTEYKVTVPPELSILEAALKQKIDLPYSCQSGLCTACMGKCISGKVHIKDSDALSDKELQQGFILTCVGHPVTSGVVIEVD